MTASNPKMVLFIPRVFPAQADQAYIASVFDSHRIGWVDHVDLIEKVHNGEHFFQAFVHFVYWYNTWEAHTLQAQINDQQFTAKIYLPQREIRPGVWRETFWIISECHNPLTPLERELQSQLFDERAQSDWEIEELRDLIAERDAFIALLLEPNDESSIEEFDPLLNTPEDVSELPIVGAELAQKKLELLGRHHQRRLEEAYVRFVKIESEAIVQEREDCEEDPFTAEDMKEYLVGLWDDMSEEDRFEYATTSNE